MVGAMNRSIAAMSGAWLRRRVPPSRGGRSASLDHILRDTGSERTSKPSLGRPESF